jgi:hypothetical protein
MTAQEFIYYLQGFLENSNPKTINEEQTALIKEKLNSCFVNVTKAEPFKTWAPEGMHFSEGKLGKLEVTNYQFSGGVNFIPQEAYDYKWGLEEVPAFDIPEIDPFISGSSGDVFSYAERLSAAQKLKYGEKNENPIFYEQNKE